MDIMIYDFVTILDTAGMCECTLQKSSYLGYKFRVHLYLWSYVILQEITLIMERLIGMIKLQIIYFLL